MALLKPNEWKYVGVDWCKGGWFCVGLDDGGNYGFAVYGTFKGLLDAVYAAELVLIDIPIGLPEGPGGRQADSAARALLDHKDRKSSVFPTPTRQTVKQAGRDPESYAVAAEIEQNTSGKGLPPPAFGIAPKIAEVDAVMVSRKTSGKTKPSIREVHPELCFCTLNNRRAMRLKKGAAGAVGVTERLQVLRRFEGKTDEIYSNVLDEYPRKTVARDDIVDALAAAVTARLACILPSGLRTAPANPSKDAKGLRMEMVYWLPERAR